MVWSNSVSHKMASQAWEMTLFFTLLSWTNLASTSGFMVPNWKYQYNATISEPKNVYLGMTSQKVSWVGALKCGGRSQFVAIQRGQLEICWGSMRNIILFSKGRADVTFFLNELVKHFAIELVPAIWASHINQWIFFDFTDFQGLLPPMILSRDPFKDRKKEKSRILCLFQTMVLSLVLELVVVMLWWRLPCCCCCHCTCSATHKTCECL